MIRARAEDSPDLFRGGVRRDVEVLRPHAEQQVPDTTPHEVAVVTGVLQAPDNVQRGAADPVPVETEISG